MEGEAEAGLGLEVTGVVAGAEEVIGEEDEEGVAEGTEEEEAAPCVTGEGVETDSTHTEEVAAAADMVLLSCNFQNTL